MPRKGIPDQNFTRLRVSYDYEVRENKQIHEDHGISISYTLVNAQALSSHLKSQLHQISSDDSLDSPHIAQNPNGMLVSNRN
ncbi:hypothetical protein TWF128_001023 [Orbilia oligospora]|nr:hypothetical protein TWF128_001023 [Orbilia oligospora]